VIKSKKLGNASNGLLQLDWRYVTETKFVLSKSRSGIIKIDKLLAS